MPVVRACWSLSLIRKCPKPRQVGKEIWKVFLHCSLWVICEPRRIEQFRGLRSWPSPSSRQVSLGTSRTIPARAAAHLSVWFMLWWWLALATNQYFSVSASASPFLKCSQEQTSRIVLRFLLGMSCTSALFDFRDQDQLTPSYSCFYLMQLILKTVLANLGGL